MSGSKKILSCHRYKPTFSTRFTHSSIYIDGSEVHTKWDFLGSWQQTTSLLMDTSLHCSRSGAQILFTKKNITNFSLNIILLQNRWTFVNNEKWLHNLNIQWQMEKNMIMLLSHSVLIWKKIYNETEFVWKKNLAQLIFMLNIWRRVELIFLMLRTEIF